MITRVRLASVAVLLLLLGASVALAQQRDSSAARSGALPGRGAVGAQLGGSWLVAEGDYSKGAHPRFSFAGSFRYDLGSKWRWQVSPFYTWNAYKTGEPSPFTDPNFPTESTKDAYLTQIVGANAQLQRVGGSGRTRWHVGVGPAVYRVVIQNHRKTLKDPVSLRLHKGAYLGATVEYGIERFLRGLPNTSLEWTLAAHSAFANRDDQFPSGFNARVVAVELRFGGHYYFDFRKARKPDARPGAGTRP